MIHRTLACLRKARITIPQLSPTHTRARINKWCVERPINNESKSVECYDPLFVLECSPDLVTPGYRVHENHQPMMIVEAHDEGVLQIREDIEIGKWYPVGEDIGVIDDCDEEDTSHGDWLWQAYSYDSENEETK